MKITVTKLTDLSLMQRACEFTINGKSNMSLEKIYRCEHSPIRTQIFWVEMERIPAFVSVHFVRHGVGVTHFVQSLRDDRGGTGNETRNSPVNHAMLVNAQALINMARKRLCYKAHRETVLVMSEIKKQVANLDKDLSAFMVPECLYRKGCHELKSCGYYDNILTGEQGYNMDIKQLKKNNIKIYLCPITNGLKTKMMKETFEKLCKYQKEDAQKKSRLSGYCLVVFPCLTCNKKPKELEII